MQKKFLKISIFIFFFLFLPVFSFADSCLEKRIFFVDKAFDDFKRDRVLATNFIVGDRLYIYVEDEVWQNFSIAKREEMVSFFKNLSLDFDFTIYPKLTLIFGKEIEMGPNKDPKLTILFHQTKKDVLGYSREIDNYEKTIAPYSNERKMIYLSSELLFQQIAKEVLAHEFVHLILYNQKAKIQKVEEERWVQEILAELGPTLCGFEETLKSRIEIFKKFPKDSLLNWKETPQDYGVVSLFAHYLLDQFGEKTISQIAKSKETGALAIEKATQKPLEELFRDFLVAVYLGDCSFKREFCFQHPLLKNLRIVPEFHFLPTTGETVLTLYRETEEFAGEWQKIYGGKGDLKVKLQSEDPKVFSLSFLLCQNSTKCDLQFATKTNDTLTFEVPSFDKNYSSLTLFIFAHKDKIPKDPPPSFKFSLVISFQLPSQVSTTTQRQNQPQLPPPSFSCQKIQGTLRYGMRGGEVFCLQQFLKSQGPEIYPEGLVTGYFGPLTLSAVKRFQQKYWKEILAPWGLNQNQPTGIVGPTTRAKINQILSSLGT